MSTSPQWRTPENREAGEEEFLPGTSEPDALDRRDFLKMAGLSLAALSAAACTRQPREEIVPYVRQPENLTPGEPRWYATSMEVGGNNAIGVLARSHEGRPTKLDGNPDHPMSLGRSTVHLQAALYDLYDPKRSQVVRKKGEPSTWEDFLGAMQPRVARWKETRGRGLHVISDRFTSPSLHEQRKRLLVKYPEAKWHFDDAPPLVADGFTCDLEKADLVLCIDCDFLGPSYGAVPRDALIFSRRRRSGKSVRLHVWESMPSPTGAMADERRAMSPREIANALHQLLFAVRGEEDVPEWIGKRAEEWQRHSGSTAILIGGCQDARSLQFANLLGGQVKAAPAAGGGLLALRAAQARGEVQEVVSLGVSVPWLGELPFTIRCGSYAADFACTWEIPESHFLESWGDTQARDGTRALVQPLIDPLYATKSRIEVIEALLGESPMRSGYDVVRATAGATLGANGFEGGWQKALHDGRLPGAGQPLNSEANPPSDTASGESSDLELMLRPDPFLSNGRFSRNLLLQELPRPITKLTWENAACLSPKTAGEQGVVNGQVAELHYRDKVLSAPVFVVPGHADQCVTVHLGYGTSADAGFGAEVLQTEDAPWGGGGLTISPSKKHHVFSTTQEHGIMEVSQPVRTWPFAKEPEPDSLYPPVKYDGVAWGMVIDLDVCTGCSNCTIACQVENNIPTVGRGQILKGRLMHWIRVDRYYTGTLEAPEIVHQPVPCMHCEHAPCELVCPVAATVHDHQGLNLMVYNRCIGTRYCSNNCPYKVRRFNFLQYNDSQTESLKLGRNPDVTVRMRGVMEKCTYCLQRISAAQITADKENRAIRDGEVVPACVEACPTEAISFGNINDPESVVATQRAEERNYGLLEDLNTRPRTTYLARRQR